MAENMDIKKLTEYRCQINSTVVENIKESVTKLNETMAMLADFQSINEALSLVLAESDKEKQSQEYEIEVLRKKIEAMEETAQQFEEKEKQYEAMDLSMAKVTALLASLDEREKQLAISEKELAEEKQLFEEEKDSVIASKNDAEEKVVLYKKEKNDAIISRDIAIAERDRAILDKEKAENEKSKIEGSLAEVREELAEYCKVSEQVEKQIAESIESMEWYRGYAIAVDRKVVDFFRGKNEDLDRHYYTFLNNPDKLDEIHVHFPDYIIDEESKDDVGAEETEKSQTETRNQECVKNDLVKYDKKEDKSEKREKRNIRSDRPEFLD